MHLKTFLGSQHARLFSLEFGNANTAVFRKFCIDFYQADFNILLFIPFEVSSEMSLFSRLWSLIQEQYSKQCKITGTVATNFQMVQPEPEICVPVLQTQFVGQVSWTNNTMVFNFQWACCGSAVDAPQLLMHKVVRKDKRSTFMLLFC